jgi:FlaA1/EpsC-like NDP-sugar epimerase
MLDLRDLLPRRTNGIYLAAMRTFIEGRRILVTGAGGSIGSELCRHIAHLGCSALVMFERHENSLHEVMLSVDAPIAHPFLGDLLDARRVEEAFATWRPEIVFHAAAHKHVPLMEQHPGEAVKNNVTGTRLLAQAADRHGVERFVLISTDKAVNPSSVMGATKRVAELIMREAARGSSTEFVAVRFGNVLGSSGSVVPRFLEQIRAGGPLTITHPDVRRFFILIPEAVQLVIEAAALGGSGAIYVLEMGEPIRIVDLAQSVLRASGAPDTPIEYIGLRPGEKLDEELVGFDERAQPTIVPHIAEIRSDTPLSDTFAADVTRLEALAAGGSADEEVIAQLRAVVPAFTSSSAANAPAP